MKMFSLMTRQNFPYFSWWPLSLVFLPDTSAKPGSIFSVTFSRALEGCYWVPPSLLHPVPYFFILVESRITGSGFQSHSFNFLDVDKLCKQVFFFLFLAVGNYNNYSMSLKHNETQNSALQWKHFLQVFLTGKIITELVSADTISAQNLRAL